MTSVVYILHSTSLNKYYVGRAYSLDARLAKHLTNHSGYTGNAKDWIIVFSVECATKSEAVQLEKKIKKRGAQRYLDDLKKKSG